LTDGHDLGPDPSELRLEDVLLPRGAADDHASAPDGLELEHLVGDERPPRDRDERLRTTLRSVTESLALSASEKNGLHRERFSLLAPSDAFVLEPSGPGGTGV